MRKSAALLLVLVFLTALCLSVAVSAEPSAAVTGDDWSMFRYDAAHTGYTNSTGPTTTPVVLWSAKTYGPVYSSPAIVDGVVYVSAWFLHAFTASTGSELWNVTGGEMASPIVIDGYVYTGNNGSTVYNASTGAKMWSVLWRGYTFYTPFLAVDGAYVYTGYYGEAGSGGVMRALNASTGSEIWNYPTEPDSPPAVYGGYIYFGTLDGVCALNAYTGTKLWEYETDSRVESSPAVSDGVVYVGSSFANFYALDALTGNEIWSYPIMARSSPAVADGRVFVGSLDYNVYALNASTGAKIWNYTTGYVVDSSPTVAGDVVYVGSGDGNLYALNASTGAKIWNFTIQPLLDEDGLYRYLFASPAVANGTIYMGSGDGVVFALGAMPNTTPSPSPPPTLPDLQLIVIVAVVVIVTLAVLFLVYRIRQKVANMSAAQHVVSKP
jgi:outer membrane protein assembly factor BamB